MKPRKYRAKAMPQLLGIFNGEGKYTESEWVYGYYAPTYIAEIDGIFRNTYCIISDDTVGTQEMLGCGHNTGLPKAYYIIEDTLGQSTGLFDKNGKEIFEGDIVEFETNVNCLTNELKPYWKDCYEKQYKLGGGTWWVRKDQAIVQWNESKGIWDLKVYNNKRYKRKSKLFTYRDSGYIVIGNIWDNPELLGEEV